jgi:hypothetical protein
MKNLISKIAFLPLCIGLFAVSCEDINVRETEQYIKQVYIVGASDVVWSFDVLYSDEPQNVYISVATGGTQNIETDVTVKLRHNDAMIDWYNNKYMSYEPAKYRKLDDDRLVIPSMETTIRAGEAYSRLPFNIQTDGLHCDSLYAITFTIDSVSAYDKHPEDTVLILNLNLTNEYAGNYQLSAARYTLTYSGGQYIPSPNGSVSALRTLKAVNTNSVRFFNEAQADTRGGYENNEEYYKALDNWSLVFTKDEGNKFKVEPWKSFEIAEGECTYEDGTFTFWYDYISSSDNTRYRIEGTLVK